MNREYILPFREWAVMPGLTVPLYADNPETTACIEAAVKNNNRIVLAPQHDWDYPEGPGDIYDVGTIGDITQILYMPDGAIHATVRTTSAVNLRNIVVENDLFTANVEEISVEGDDKSEAILALRDKVSNSMHILSTLRKFKSDRLRKAVQKYPLPAFIDAIMHMAALGTESSVRILLATSWHNKLVILLERLRVLLEAAKIDDSINRRIHQQMEYGRREALLQEKLRAIQQEIGEDNEENETERMRRRIEKAGMSPEAQTKALSELRRMRSMAPMSNDNALLKSYLEELLAMPWNKCDATEINLDDARKILNSQHSGMDAVKERILEHIAVMKKTCKPQGSILCFVGAPGVGKTSLCKSIAAALGRKYHRISLGGISDEAHFRGHRKTYIGAQVGRIMDALKRCKTNNPVIVLDEIDKMGRDWRGDPEAALLEILDPEQNKTFRDHYLEVDFDLSKIVFIATANSLNMSAALKDRMEIIEVPAYNEEDKLRIARDHLITRAAQDTGWDTANIVMDDDAVRDIIRNHTSEQGVRQLQRELTAVLRRALLENNGEDVYTEFTVDKVNKLLAGRGAIGTTKRIGFGAKI